MANLPSCPEAKVEALSRTLNGLLPRQAGQRVRDHPQPAARLRGRGTRDDLVRGLEELIGLAGSRQRGLVTAMITAAVIDGSSKAGHRPQLRAETTASWLGGLLSLEACDEGDLMPRWTGCCPRQKVIEDALAAHHLNDGTLVLYDMSSEAFERRTCPLGQVGHAPTGC